MRGEARKQDRQTVQSYFIHVPQNYAEENSDFFVPTVFGVFNVKLDEIKGEQGKKHEIYIAVKSVDKIVKLNAGAERNSQKQRKKVTEAPSKKKKKDS